MIEPSESLLSSLLCFLYTLFCFSFFLFSLTVFSEHGWPIWVAGGSPAFYTTQNPYEPFKHAPAWATVSSPWSQSGCCCHYNSTQHLWPQHGWGRFLPSCLHSLFPSSWLFLFFWCQPYQCCHCCCLGSCILQHGECRERVVWFWFREQQVAKTGDPFASRDQISSWLQVQRE